MRIRNTTWLAWNQHSCVGHHFRGHYTKYLNAAIDQLLTQSAPATLWNHRCCVGKLTVSETFNKLYILTDSARKMANGRGGLAQALNLPLVSWGLGLRRTFVKIWNCFQRAVLPHLWSALFTAVAREALLVTFFIEITDHKHPACIKAIGYISSQVD